MSHCFGHSPRQHTTSRLFPPKPGASCRASQVPGDYCFRAESPLWWHFPCLLLLSPGPVPGVHVNAFLIGAKLP